LAYIRNQIAIMKSTGTCPKCNSTKLYTNAGLAKRGDRSMIALSSWKGLYVDVYVCSQCGFIEEYASTRELENPTTLEKLKTNWKKVNE